MSLEKLPKVVKVLEKEIKASPSKIAAEVGSDRRTVGKVLNVASELGIVKCESLEVGGRKYAVCSLTLEYQKILKERAKNLKAESTKHNQTEVQSYWPQYKLTNLRSLSQPFPTVCH